MTGIVLATPSAAFEQRVRRALGPRVNGGLRRLADAIDAGDAYRTVIDLTVGDPSVVVLGPGVNVDDALEVAQALDVERPHVSVVVVAEPTPELWQRALRAGVRDVLAPDVSDAEMLKTFERAAQTAQRRKVPTADDGAPSDTGRIITVLAPKGGSGKTAVATNTAVGLASTAPGQVVLVDLDLTFGDVTNALRLVPEHTMFDAAAASSRLDITMLKVFLTPRRSDLFVLCAPDKPDQGEQVREGDIHRILNLLAAEFRYVVVDTSAGVSEWALTAVEVATDLVLVCDLSLSGVRGMRKLVDALDSLKMIEQRRHVVLNRADSRVGLDISDVAATIGRDIDVKIPSARAVPLSMNQGVPILESSPRSPVARQLSQLVGRLVGDRETEGAGMSIRRRRQ